MPQTFVLIHSPLVGPTTWSLVAARLRRGGASTVVPSLHDARCSRGPSWQQHANCVASALGGVLPTQHLVLVGHSGAGPLLPALRRAVARPVDAYIFVDAALPGIDGQSRLDLFKPAEAEQFRAAAVGGMIPAVWRNDDLLKSLGIDDKGLRQSFASDVPDVPLAVYEEPLPVPPHWPDAPCGYLRFSAQYKADALRARSLNWPVRELEGSHLHMLVDPNAVTDALLELAVEVGA